MANNLTVLKSTELNGHQLNVYGTPQEPLFLAKDVAEMLEHSDVTMMLRSVDEDEKLTQTMFVSGQNRQVNMLTERGLYELLFVSRKPIAKQFKKAVKDMLQELRAKKAVVLTDGTETDEELVARALQAANRTIARRDARIAQLEADNAANAAQIEVLTEQTQEQAETIKKQAVKVNYVDSVLNATNAWTSTQIAPELGYRTAHALHIALAEKGVMKRANGMWVLTAKYTESGYAKTRTFTQTLEDGTTRTRLTTVWTEKGRAFLHSHFNKNIA